MGRSKNIEVNEQAFAVALESLTIYMQSLEIAVKEAYELGWDDESIADLEEQLNVVATILEQFAYAAGADFDDSSGGQTIH